MSARCLWMLATLAMSSVALAQPPDSAEVTRGDSARVVPLREVVVQGESIVMRAAAASQPTSILSRATIESAQARDASDVIALAPGAFIRQYGGIGGLRTLSLRGASAQQSVILIDGVRYQSSAVGAVDLGSIPASALYRVEVVRGGDAARYGANALGGVVNLITTPSLRTGTSASARVDAGSFGERVATLAASTATPHGGALDASLTYTGSEGNYPFTYREYGQQQIVRRSNADLESLFGRLSWAHPLTPNARISASLLGSSSSRGVPGAIVQGHREQEHARLDERELFGVARAQLGIDGWQTSTALSGRVNHLAYVDPDARYNGPLGVDNAYDRFELALAARAQRAIGDDALFEASAELGHARLRGDNLDPGAGSVVDRLQWSVSAATHALVEDVVGLGSVAGDVALRADGFSDLPGAVSPSLGIVVRPLDGPLRIRSHLALGYRAPSFTEQYYLNYGNAELRPERSMSIDVGVTVELAHALMLEGTFFSIDTRDQIIAVPRSPLVWSAQNIARTVARGLELGASGTALDGLIAINASYTRMRAEDRTAGPTHGRLLLYSPEETASMLLEWRPRPFAIGIVAQSVSHRHTLPSNDPAAALPRYSTLGAHISARASWRTLMFVGRVEGFNLFDTQYQVVRNYPMPGREFRIGLEVSVANH